MTNHYIVQNSANSGSIIDVIHEKHFHFHWRRKVHALQPTCNILELKPKASTLIIRQPGSVLSDCRTVNCDLFDPGLEGKRHKRCLAGQPSAMVAQELRRNGLCKTSGQPRWVFLVDGSTKLSCFVNPYSSSHGPHSIRVSMREQIANEMRHPQGQ